MPTPLCHNATVLRILSLVAFTLCFLLASLPVSCDAQDLGRKPDDPRGFAYGTYDETWKYRNRFRNRVRFNHPTHMILAPRTLRPSSIYRCVVSVMNLDHPVDVRASLQKDGVELSYDKKAIIKGYPETLLLKVPRTGVQGHYRLRVEGNIPGTFGGTVFYNDTQLHFSTQFLTVLFQANRPVYTGDQIVRFRIILLTTELKPYDDPVDVYILDPDGYVMRRWPSRPTNVGVISMSFKLPFLPKVGWWMIRAIINGQIEEQHIKVEKWYTPRFETKVYMQKYFLDTDDAVHGSIEGEYGTDKGVYGNATMRLYTRNQVNMNWSFVMQYDVLVFDGEVDYSFSMIDISVRVPTLDGSEVRVEAEVHDAFMNMNHTSFSHAKIINSSINCRFIGSPPFIFKPGMPFDATVAVSYHDLEALSPEKLERSKLIIKAEVVSDGGAREVVMEIQIPQVNAEEAETQFLDSSWSYNKRRQDYQAQGPGYNAEDYEEYNTDNNYDYNSDTRYLTENELVERKMEIFVNNQRFQKYREKGVFQFRVDIPDKAAKLTLTASYQDDDGGTAGATARGIAIYSAQKQFIGVETSNNKASVGEFVVFHVRSNFNLQSFHYLIMAKEMILYAGKEEASSGTGGFTVKTLSVPVSSEMAPAFKVVVYHLTQYNEVITDSLTMPVDGISSHKVKLVLNQEKDHSLRTVEMGTYSTAGAFFGVSGARYFSYAMKAGNELSHASVLNALHSFANNTRSIHKMQWRDRAGYNPDTVQYFVAGNYGPDANRTFDFNGLVIFTDAYVGTLPGYRDNRCNASEGFSACLMGDCYLTRLRCNGFEDCSDGFDEVDCHNPLEDRETDFRIHQFERFADFFDAEDGDWMWIDTNIGYKGHEQNTIDLPKVDDPYVVNAFSISKAHGFGLIEAPQEFQSLPHMYMLVEMPDTCKRGEQVGLRVQVHNMLDQEQMIMLILHGTDQHKSVIVEANGVVDFYHPRTMYGDRQHLLSVDPEGSVEVVFPIVATIEHGEIELTVSAITQVGRDFETVSLTVEPEGALIHRHTSTLLDLKNRAIYFEHLDIIIEESFTIPLKVRRRFVAGSPMGHISLCGDVVGPSFPNGGPVDTEQMLRKTLRGTEASVFNFGANLWTLHYLRLTNQFDLIKLRPVFDRLNEELAAIMYRFDKEGGFRMWDNSAKSVWLTAWTTRVLQQAQFQDWENLIYIEPQILSRAVNWLLKWQTKEGTFMETPDYQEIPLDHKMSSYPGGGTQRWRGQRNITLTANVLLTLQACINALQGNVRAAANNAIVRSIRYLERELGSISDPYDMAIVTYALTMTGSSDKDLAINALDRMKREQNGLIYWSREAIDTNSRVYENNQRNLLQPKFEKKLDSHAVEASSYALLVFLIRDGVNVMQERIVEWLNSMRMHDGGFISTVDTLVALQALTEHSYRARLRYITDMKVMVEATGEEGRRPHTVHIGNTSISHMNYIPIDNVWGMVNVVVHGAGQALLQLDVSYGVDWEGLKKQPPVDAFDMTINERFEKFGNKSMAIVTICARWVNLEESPTSSATVIEVENPTGYVVYQLDAEKSIRNARNNRTFPSITDVLAGHADTHARKTVWFFDYIPGNDTWCFEYEMRRWYPVANMTRVRMATIYEQYQPERFQMVMFNSTTWSLDVCEVCASYQCPYCPAFSGVGPLIPYATQLGLFVFMYTMQYIVYNAWCD